MLITLGVVAQTNESKKIDVIGTVLDEYGEPLIGVNVILKNSPEIGTVTNIDGVYKLSGISPYEILRVSYVGYDSQEIPVTGKTKIDVTMKPAKELNEVVVVGYGHQKKSSVIGAISNLTPKDLKVPSSTVTHALGGRIAGVVATQRSGEPGADNAGFTIRGLSTFGSGSSPLVLVDGIEGRSINDIDIEDIASFSVLKDASATAVYGVKGANGVVMITTRKGSEGKINITTRYDFGITTPFRMPKFVNSQTYATLKNYALEGRGQPKEYSDMELEKFKYGLDPDLYPDVDWLKELTKSSATTQKAHINISGGTQTARYYISLGYYNEKGFLRNLGGNGYDTNIDMDKITFRSNIDVKVTPTTDIELGVGGILFDRYRPKEATGTILGNIMTMNPTKFPMVYSDGRLPKFESQANPYLSLTQYGYTQEIYSEITANLTANQNLDIIVKGLRASVKYAYDTQTSYNSNYVRSVNTWEARGRDADGTLIAIPKDQGHTGALSYSRTGDSGRRNTYLEGSLNYGAVFADLHKVDALMLYNHRSNNSYYYGGDARYGLPYRSQGLSGRLAYSFDDRYFGEFNFGYNGSENFMSGKRFGFFPSFAAGWMVSNESWFKPITKYVSELKLRGSYGLIGNDQTGAGRFPFYTTVADGIAGYNFGIYAESAFNGASEGLIGSPNLTWEKSKKTNLGVEIGLFNKVKLIADIFKEKRTDIFVRRNSLPLVVGIPSGNLPSANLGEMENRGVDLSLDIHNQVGKVTLGFFGTFTFNRNKVLKTEQPPALYSYQERQNRKYYGTIDMASDAGMGYIALGLFKDQEEIDNSPRQASGSDLRPGDIKYKDVNGDGVVDKFDKVFMQSNTPEISYGFGFSALYAGFDFSIFFQGLGNSNTFLPEDINPFFDANETGNIMKDVANNIFIPESISGDPRTENYNAKYPRMGVPGGQRNNLERSTYWLRSTAFLRLKNAEIGYTLPQPLSQKLLMSNVRVYVSGNNLAIFDSLKLWDPELSGYGSYPINTTITTGVRVNF